MPLTLKLIDIDKLIEQENLKEVKSAKPYIRERVGRFDPEGLWSEEIFGPVGSEERRKKFAYVNLGTVIIHPQLYPVVGRLSPSFQKCLTGKGKFKVQNGKLVQSDDGGFGPLFIYENFDKIDWSQYELKDPRAVKAILKYGKKMFYDKWLILPAGVRDILQVGKTQRVQYSEINMLYVQLVSLVTTEAKSISKYSLSVAVQEVINKIAAWIKNRMKGKSGAIRGMVLRKTVDFCARGTIVGNPKLDIDQIELPWYVCIKLFEPFVIHKLMKERQDLMQIIADVLELESTPNVTDLQRFLREVADNKGTTIPPFLRDQLRELVAEIVTDKLVLCKRDPVETRANWFAARVVVSDGTYFGIHPSMCTRLQGDFDGDAIGVYAVLTEEAQKEAEKLLPSKSRTSWLSVKNYGDQHHTVELDAAAIIYYATS